MKYCKLYRGNNHGIPINLLPPNKGGGCSSSEMPVLQFLIVWIDFSVVGSSAFTDILSGMGSTEIVGVCVLYFSGGCHVTAQCLELFLTFKAICFLLVLGLNFSCLFLQW